MNKILLISASILLVGFLIQRGMKESAESNKIIKKKSIQYIINKYSNDCDKIILRELENNQSLDYVSGYFIINLSENQQVIQLKAEMYFQDNEGNWLKKESTDTVQSNRLYQNDLEELKSKQELKYELSSPKLPQVSSN
ncbi:hypothetical protein DOE78_11585 [Bacillus sp. Y1]|nr:hypothetical protein [Bacillus sp. Y1]AYA76027.1 hypothetical protein DOE78_11585 [Bacillus sp. Y1]